MSVAGHLRWRWQRHQLGCVAHQCGWTLCAQIWWRLRRDDNRLSQSPQRQRPKGFRPLRCQTLHRQTKGGFGNDVGAISACFYATKTVWTGVLWYSKYLRRRRHSSHWRQFGGATRGARLLLWRKLSRGNQGVRKGRRIGNRPLRHPLWGQNQRQLWRNPHGVFAKQTCWWQLPSWLCLRWRLRPRSRVRRGKVCT